MQKKLNTCGLFPFGSIINNADRQAQNTGLGTSFLPALWQSSSTSQGLLYQIQRTEDFRHHKLQQMFAPINTLFMHNLRPFLPQISSTVLFSLFPSKRLRSIPKEFFFFFGRNANINYYEKRAHSLWTGSMIDRDAQIRVTGHSKGSFLTASTWQSFPKVWKSIIFHDRSNK